ncbi:LemA family protein [Lampropedia puyangensis]|uniref:LemA family protein n=1 Tax=Lampropedia puyangensis TaxID=1330072 RepID=A0A4S8EX66_9BURK|nr:LemA family protein [Lampropedia puyangensis]THT99392.1 LemA family protein [Lampropedia puyangensis]
MSTTAIVVIAVLVALVLWYVVTYNRFVGLRNEVKNAFAQIDVQLKRRYDLIPNLVEVARGYMQHERETLEAVAAARSNAVTAAQQARANPADGGALMALAGAEGVLGAGLGRLMALSEAYPELKADREMQRLSEEIASTENRIGFARQAYNDTVLAFNTATEEFPSNIVATLNRFPSLPMLQSTTSEQERQAPQVRFGQ